MVGLGLQIILFKTIFDSNEIVDEKIKRLSMDPWKTVDRQVDTNGHRRDWMAMKEVSKIIFNTNHLDEDEDGKTSFSLLKRAARKEVRRIEKINEE
jgi:hypothetical protein